MDGKAFFGGSFDPPHLGHLGVARAALRSGRCRRVVWFPGFMPPHKTDRRRAAFSDRMAMVKLLISGEPDMEVSDYEDRLRLSPSYTIDVLRRLHLDTGEKYRLLIGADSLLNLHTWHEADALVREFEIITYPRNGATVTADALSTHWDRETAEKLAATEIPGKIFEISSRELRFSMEKILSPRHIIRGDGLTGEVAAYIMEHGLYTKFN